jgi:hypothetical protein
MEAEQRFKNFHWSKLQSNCQPGEWLGSNHLSNVHVVALEDFVVLPGCYICPSERELWAFHWWGSPIQNLLELFL